MSYQTGCRIRKALGAQQKNAGRDCSGKQTEQFLRWRACANSLLVHAVLNRPCVVDEAHGNFVVVLAAEFKIAVDVYFLTR